MRPGSRTSSPAGRPAALSFIGALAALTACHKNDIALFDVKSASFDYFFLVSVDENDRPERATTPFGLDNGVIAFGGRPIMSLGPGESSAVLVGLTQAQLRGIHGGFDPARAMELAVSIATPPSAPQILPGNTRVASPLPAQAIALRSGRSGASMLPSPFLDRLLLTLPVDVEYCRADHPTELHPFGAAPLLFPDSRMIPGDDAPAPDSPFRALTKVRWVDPDRVLMLAAQALYVVGRGGDVRFPASSAGYDPHAPSSVIHLASLGFLKVEGLAVDPRPTGPGLWRILIAGTVSPHRGALSELELSDAGLRAVATATIAAVSRIDELHDVAVDAAGNAIAVGEPSVVLVEPSGSGRFVPAPNVETGVDLIFGLAIATGDAAHPHLIGDNGGRLLTGNAVTGSWEVYHRPDALAGRRYRALAAGPGGAELWAVGELGEIIRRTGASDFTPLDLLLPPRFFPCAGMAGASGPPALAQAIRGVALSATDAYLAMESCTALLRVRQSDLCASVITSPGEDVAVSNLVRFDADFAAGRLIVSGQSGLLLELDAR